MNTRPPCSVDGCDKPRRIRGWCGMHHQRWLTHGDVGWYARLVADIGPQEVRSA